MRKETLAIRTQSKRSEFNEHSTSLHLTSSYVFDDADDMRLQFNEEREGQIYSRYANPNVQEFINKMALLEKAEAGWATATGMAAVYTCLSALLISGDHIVSSRSVFGSTHKLFTEILPTRNVQTTYVDATDYTGYEKAIKANKNTKIVFIETPSNPALTIIDIERLAKICKHNSVLLVVDNCFATPVIQRPIEWGADIVIHSATKYIDGQGRTMGGVILGSNEVIQKIKNYARHSGPALSPFNAWVLSKSLETLCLRMERHSSNALEIAKRLEKSNAVDKVYYPGLESHVGHEVAKKQMDYGGGIVAFEIKGGIQKGKSFLDELNLFSLTANLGDTRSIATHPASTTHSKLTPEQRLEVNITDGLIRLSVGLEHVEDIWEDIYQALSV